MLEQYDDNNYWRDDITHSEASDFMEEIKAFIRRENDRLDKDRGMMEYYNSGSVNDKVHSLFISVEEHEGKLWFVADLALNAPLTPVEMAELKDWWHGQLSDGIGESIEQREIKVGGGELYIEPWKNSDRFFIDTQAEFAQRFGLTFSADDAFSQVIASKAEMPRQAALHKTEVVDDQNVAAMRTRLMERLNRNLSDYFDTLRNLDERNITSMTSEIGAMMDAHFYLGWVHRFDTPELEYLLKFQNPLSMVAECFETVGIDGRLLAIEDIFDKREVLQSVYELAPEAVQPSFAELKQRLKERLTENFVVYKRDMLDCDNEELFKMADEIANVQQAYEYFTNDHPFTEPEVKFLLKLENPLELISDKWGNQLQNISHTIKNIFDKQEQTLQGGGYRLMTDNPAPIPTIKEPVRKAAVNGEKPSVLEQIRQAAKESRERLAVPKEKNDRKKIGPEL